MHEVYFRLVEALYRFSPDMGNTFTTYAAHWINQLMRRFLDYSGRVIRVLMHIQEKIYKYNQITSYFLQNFNREPDQVEYCRWMRVSPAVLEKLEYSMLQETIRSLDEVVPGGEDENLSFADVVPADVDIEEDAVEKLAAEQLRKELWNIVTKTLKENKKLQIFRMRFIDKMTME